MIVGFTTTYAISAYHYKSCAFESRSWRCVLPINLVITIKPKNNAKPNQLIIPYFLDDRIILQFVILVNVNTGKNSHRKNYATIVRKIHISYIYIITWHSFTLSLNLGGHRRHDRMVVGFTTTCAISAYHRIPFMARCTWYNIMW